MSDKKLRNAIDSLRGDMQELAEAFWAFRDNVSTQQAVAAAEQQSASSKSAHTATVESLQDRAKETGGPGYVSTYGVYETEGDRPLHFHWSLEEQPIQELLEVSADSVAQVLAALGNQQRLSIVVMMLARPATATDVVTALSLGTTGAAYHHLNVLQAAGLVEQQQRGIFTIVPTQAPVILTILGAFSGSLATGIANPDHVSAGEDDNADEKDSSKEGRKKLAA